LDSRTATRGKLDGPSEVGSGALHEQPVPLSQLIDVVNERFGTDFNQADQLFFDQIVEAALGDESLRRAAAVNPGEKFELLFKNVLESLFVDRMDQNEEIFVRYMNDGPFQKVVTTWMADEAYRRLRGSSVPESAQERAQVGQRDRQLRKVTGDPSERYRTSVPLVPLRVAAGRFSEPQHMDSEEFEWVEVGAHHALRPGMFVAQVVGRSMLPTIPDGAWCLFRAPVEGTRQGKIVLVQLRDSTDSETGERYTVKRYESVKEVRADGWQHQRVVLQPINRDFQPIEIHGADDEELRVIAEFVEVVS
jgi:SOS-response transcriptional repressor LexA